MPHPSFGIFPSLSLLPGEEENEGESGKTPALNGLRSVKTSEGTGRHVTSLFAFNSKGKLETVLEGTPECTTARVYHVAVCPEGFREDNPSFGVPEPVFHRVPLDLAEYENAIRRSEPEAVLETTESAEGPIQSQRRVRIEVGS